MKKPDVSDWHRIAEGFQRNWQFPNCLGAVDGKHVRIRAPPNSGSMYHNYKDTFSIVLLAVADADYKCVVVDVGAYGKQSDGGILKHSQFGQMLDAGTLPIPGPQQLPGTTCTAPCVFLGDEAFQLRPNFLRPFPGEGLDRDKRIFNFRSSRAR
ncbi:uncharacterized protein LOC135380913 [Ornithodoros turicata]|uniref:uncharacterized protein LOC135380913 n=1 Tax=Ornithodoros turicata TaxID=34597 RepID=UPI003139803C